MAQALQTEPLDAADAERLDAYWRAANYLSVGQIYLLDNPLLREPLLAEHVKPRLLGHFGTTPGLNVVYAHLNRAIRRRSLNLLYVTGPGHGGPGLVANAYLEGTYSEVYPHVGRDEDGRRELAREQAAQPAHRRRGPPDPAPQRLQDCEPDTTGANSRGGTGGADARVWIRAALHRDRRGRRACRCAPALCRSARRRARPDRLDPASGADGR